ncbi:MAG: RluA family pseudouridine synthase [Oscillospiraceae bacterium]|nr:RluA family pseudouridine synthase [Oscillospiraceae bacterium]
MTQLTLTVAPSQSGRCVRSLLKNELGLSTTCINRLKRTEHGLICNGQRVFTNAVVSTGDVLTVEIDAASRPTEKISPIEMPLDIVFEDEHLLVINKSAPLAVIPSSFAPDEPTLANALAHYLGSGFTYHPVNRLDRGTTGLMVVAKNGLIHDRLRRALHTGAFFRRYLAVCLGAPTPAAGEITLPIGRKEGSAIARCISEDGQAAHSSYRTLEQTDRFSLVELTPHTGRTHQLRVHMAAISHPLVGDWLYGTEDHSLISRPALHAAELSVQHPITAATIALTAPLPADMKRLLEFSSCLN